MAITKQYGKNRRDKNKDEHNGKDVSMAGTPASPAASTASMASAEAAAAYVNHSMESEMM